MEFSNFLVAILVFQIHWIPHYYKYRQIGRVMRNTFPVCLAGPAREVKDYRFVPGIKITNAMQ